MSSSALLFFFFFFFQAEDGIRDRDLHRRPARGLAGTSRGRAGADPPTPYLMAAQGTPGVQARPAFAAGPAQTFERRSPLGNGRPLAGVLLGFAGRALTRFVG